MGIYPKIGITGLPRSGKSAVLQKVIQMVQEERKNNSRKMYKDIIKLGLKPNKTKTVKFPTNKIIPHKLMRHFMRGVFD